MTEKTTLSPFKQLAQAAKARVQQTDVATLKQRIDAGEAFYLIDVREADEFARGAIPGAIHLSKGIIERDINEVAPHQDAPIVLYCGGGSRSALAADNLQTMGYTRVESMNGGYRGWLQASEEA
jgi:rhodanese-related sulfurtransferase